MSERWQLLRYAMTGIDSKLNKLAGRKPFTLGCEIESTYSLMPGGAVIDLTYRMTGTDNKDNEPAWRGTITLAWIWRYVESDQEPPHELIPELTQHTLRVAEPYLRQLVHEYTMWHGLPPLVIDLGRSSPKVTLGAR